MFKRMLQECVINGSGARRDKGILPAAKKRCSTRLPTNCKELYGQKPQTVFCTVRNPKYASRNNLEDHGKNNRTGKSLETSHNLLFLTPEHMPVNGGTDDLGVSFNLENLG